MGVVDVQPNAQGLIYKDFPPQTDALETGEKYVPKVSGHEVPLVVILEYLDANGDLLAYGQRDVYVQCQ